MSKATKNLLILAGVLLIVGAILAGIGYSMGGMRPTRLTADGIVVGNRSFGSTVTVDERWEKLTSLDIDLALLDLQLEEGDSFSLKGSYSPDVIALYISESGGTLTIRGESRDHPWWNFGIDDGDAHVTRMVLTYPKGTTFRDVSINNNLGSLHMERLSAMSLAVSLDLGSFTGRDISVGTLDVYLALGDCNLDGLDVAKEADITMNLGSLDMTIDAPEGDIGYTIECNMGSATLNGRNLGSNLGSSARSGTSPPKLMLDVSVNLGSVDIKTR
jgi:hypothetical protein